MQELVTESHENCTMEELLAWILNNKGRSPDLTKVRAVLYASLRPIMQKVCSSHHLDPRLLSSLAALLRGMCRQFVHSTAAIWLQSIIPQHCKTYTKKQSINLSPLQHFRTYAKEHYDQATSSLPFGRRGGFFSNLSSDL